MIAVLILTVIAGAFAAFFNIVPTFLSDNSGVLTDWFLYLLLFLIGFDLGNNRESLKTILKADRYTVLVPLGTIFGTLFGGFLASFVVNLSVMDSMAVSAGFGWYSYSGIILAKVRSADLGAIAFLSNVMRESMSFILIPILAKYVGPLTSVAPGGATTMDVTLPVIEKYAGKRAAVVGFVQGVILSTITPFVIPLFV